MEKQRDKLARRAQRKQAREDGIPTEGSPDYIEPVEDLDNLENPDNPEDPENPETAEADEAGELTSEPGQQPK